MATAQSLDNTAEKIVDAPRSSNSCRGSVLHASLRDGGDDDGEDFDVDDVNVTDGYASFLFVLIDSQLLS